MNERPTPETDEQINGKPCTRFAIMAGDSLRDALVPSEFARKLERERDEARKDLAEERHAWEKEREDWQADYAAVATENKAMREAIKEAHQAIKAVPIEYDPRFFRAGKWSEEALAKLQPFLA